MYSGLFPIDLNYTVDKEVVGLTARPELAAFTAFAAWVNFFVFIVGSNLQCGDFFALKYCWRLPSPLVLITKQCADGYSQLL